MLERLAHDDERQETELNKEIARHDRDGGPQRSERRDQHQRQDQEHRELQALAAYQEVALVAVIGVAQRQDGRCRDSGADQHGIR
jgi:hypothetical protein